MRKSCWSVIPVLIFLLMISSFCATAVDFVDGDLYLLSRALPDTIAYEGIVRIEPLTGTVTELYRSDVSLNPSLTFDTYRDQLLFTLPDSGLVGINADGVMEVVVPTIELGGLPRLAARGDGIIYLWFGWPKGFGYVDSANAVHDLLDTLGAATFTFASGSIIEDMIYDETTNALICLTGLGVFPECPGWGVTCAASIPLNAAGTQVDGPVASVSSDVVAGQVEKVVGVGHYSEPGEMLVFLGKNTVPGYDIIQHLDVQSMAFSAYATPIFVGDNVVQGGIYSRVLDQAVINDTFWDLLRAYALNDSGGGDTLGTGNSSAGYAESARMVEIPATTSTGVNAIPIPEQGLRLDAPRPNPFNPSTTIQFVLHRAAATSVSIFDVKGRLIQTLIDGHRGAGEHTVRWNGRDDDGRDVASGVYFIHLHSGSESGTGRIVLIR